MMNNEPSCFGTQPVPTSSLYAERSCHDCPHMEECGVSTFIPTPTQLCKVNHLTNGENLGFKQDQGKLRWSLLPKGVISSILKVLEFGAAKYSVDNWRHVEDHERRYYDAAMRHIEAWRLKETNDPESKLPHLAHAVCCLMFLMWFDGRSNG